MRIRFYLTIFIVIVTTLGLSGQNGFLKASGKKIVDANGNEVILRGMGLGGWMLQEGYMLETADFAGTQHKIKQTLEELVGEEATEEFYVAWLENYCQKKDIDSMAAWGFNSIRLPMHYNLFTLPIEDEPVAGKDTWLEKGFEMVDQLLDWCEANEIYLILDLHAAPGGQGKDANISDYDPEKPSLWESSENQRKTISLWKKLAERYANEPWIGGYDLINEPNWDIDKAGNQNGCSCNKNTALWDLYKSIIRAIRTVDNNHIVIIEGNCWGNNYNGMPAAKTFDGNLVMSFHKYWNNNSQGSISGIIDLRNTHNVPVWLGESGENSNTWFTNAIGLVESNGIGWAWWPYKKIGSATGTVTIPKTQGWQTLLDYWKGNGAKPSEEQARIWIMEQVEMMKLENCIIHYDVLDAMFRQVNSTETVPFKKHEAPGTIFATDYDLGRNGYAYSDTDTANYRTDSGNFEAWNSGYVYRNDGVDIEACNDTQTNGYSVGWTVSGEWLQYTIDIEKTAAYTIDVRYAAQGGNGKLLFELDGVAVSPQISLPATGGWSNWGTTSIPNVVLKQGSRKLKLRIINAGFNINYLKIHTPVQTGSITPDILNIKTNSSGDKILLTTNVGYDLSSIPASSEFQLKVNNSLKKIGKVYAHETSQEILVLENEGTLMSADKVFLSYNGTSLKTNNQSAYRPFDFREVENNAPTFFLLPGRFQAEDFVVNNGFQLETCTDTGAGKNLSYANSGDYTDYDVYFPYKGTFRFDYRVATQASGRFELQLVDNTTHSTIHSGNISATGGWQNWKTISYEAPMTEGKKRIRFFVNSGEFNLNWISVTTLTQSVQYSDKKYMNASYSIDNSSINIAHNYCEDSAGEIRCFDIYGRLVFKKKVMFSGEQTVVPVNEFINGLYILNINLKEDFLSQKIYVR
jgi:aryl-phospho-beta-D-glucosidase BglC (GH1 family)